MKIHLISYGDARYKVQRDFFRETAVSSSFFDEVTIFSEKDMDPEFIAEFNEILQNSTGGGFVWKPYFIKKSLERLEEDDILIYCDAGCMVNNWGKERFAQYIDKLITSKKGILAFELDHKEYENTKKEVFEYFNTDQEIVDSNQLMATIILIRKCAYSSMIVDEWNRVLKDNSKLFSDEVNAGIQHPGFLMHRHDQSIWSVILKRYKADIIPDETYFKDFMRDGQFFPFWSTRLGRFDTVYVMMS